MIPLGDEQDVAVLVEDETDGTLASGVREGAVVDGVLQCSLHRRSQIIDLRRDHLHVGGLVFLFLPVAVIGHQQNLAAPSLVVGLLCGEFLGQVVGRFGAGRDQTKHHYLFARFFKQIRQRFAIQLTSQS